MKSIDDVEAATFAAVATSPTLEELSSAAGTLKSIAEARQSGKALEVSLKQLQATRLQSIGSFLVPLVSILALVGTLVVQSIQISTTTAAANRTIEDTEWRDLMTSLKGPADQVFSDVAIAPRLVSFQNSPTYGGQAKSIAGLLLGQYANTDGFDELFDFVYPTVTTSNVNEVIAVSRELRQSRVAIERKCPRSFDCNTGVSLDTSVKVVPPDVLAINHSLINLYDESTWVSRKLQPLITAAGRDRLDLSNANFSQVNFSNADFSKDNLSGTIFDGVDLTNSELTTTSAANVEFLESNWWDAKSIDRGLLRYAMTRWNPKYFPTVKPITTEVLYKQQVKRLCAANGMLCPDIPWGTVQNT